MAFWRGDEHRRAKQPEWRRKLPSVTVPQPFHKPTEEMKMAEPTPTEQAYVKEAVADVKAVVAEAPSAFAKAKAFVAKHEKIFAILGVLAVLSAVLHFV